MGLTMRQNSRPGVQWILHVGSLVLGSAVVLAADPTLAQAPQQGSPIGPAEMIVKPVPRPPVGPPEGIKPMVNPDKQFAIDKNSLQRQSPVQTLREENLHLKNPPPTENYTSPAPDKFEGIVIVPDEPAKAP